MIVEEMSRYCIYTKMHSLFLICFCVHTGGSVQMNICVAHQDLTDQQRAWLWNSYHHNNSLFINVKQ